MKRIPLRDRQPFRAREVIIGMLEAPGGSAQGITYQEMRKRDRILDIVERAPPGDHYIDLEDADYAVLLGVLNGAAFGTAKRELRKILDEIANARSPEETPSLKMVADGGGGD